MKEPTKNQIMEATGLSYARVTKLRKEGVFPLRGSGATLEEYAEIADRWLAAHGGKAAAHAHQRSDAREDAPLRKARATKEKAIARREELKTAQLEGQLVNAMEVEERISDIVQGLSAYLDALPGEVQMRWPDLPEGFVPWMESHLQTGREELHRTLGGE